MTIESLYQLLKRLRSEDASYGSLDVRIQLGYSLFHRVESTAVCPRSDTYGPFFYLIPEDKITT